MVTFAAIGTPNPRTSPGGHLPAHTGDELRSPSGTLATTVSMAFQYPAASHTPALSSGTLPIVRNHLCH